MKELVSYLKTGEIKIFLYFLPLIVGVLVVNLLFGSFPVSLINAILILIAGGMVLTASARAAKMDSGDQLEKSKMRSIVSGLEDALVVYDQSNQITFFNSAAETLFGFRADKVLGREMRPQDVEDPALKTFVQVLFPSLAPTLVPRTAPGTYPQVTDISLPDEGLELRVTTTPIADQGGRLLGFMKMVRNRTREASLIKAKDEFITVASHQLRTPITEVNWALESLSEDKSLDENAHQLAIQTLASAKKLLVIVEDLLNTSKIEEGRFGYNFETLDLIGLISKLLEDALPHVQKAGVQLYFEKPQDELPEVMVDKNKISMVVSNLIDNAVRYNVKNGQVIVGVKRSLEGPFLEISVKDTGIGVPAEEVNNLFKKFFRSSNAVKFQTEGSGLGLYIARNIVQAHGGKMWAESEINRGTKITFTIPTDRAFVPTKEVAAEV